MVGAITVRRTAFLPLAKPRHPGCPGMRW